MALKTLLAATAGAALLGLGVATSASAAIIIVDHNLAGSLDTILLDATDTGADNKVLGESDTGFNVLFTSDVNIKPSGGPGQAWLQGTTEGMDFLDVSVINGTFTDLEFNINGGNDPWTITIRGYDVNGDEFTEYFSAKPNGTIEGGPFGSPAIFPNLTGNEFINLRATGGDVFTHVSYSMSEPTPLGQVRIGGIAEVVAVPEPATWAMMITGFGAAGAMLRRRRRVLA